MPPPPDPLATTDDISRRDSFPDGAAAPSAPRMASAAARLELLEEIARGGMGAVLKARDADLGRVVAVKVLLESPEPRPALARRFLEEARIASRLQHPGVAPVYALGRLPDGRPFFAMKLVEGRTLAALLAERPDPSADRPRFLAVFEQVCQTVAYAHSKGVIHRDLKPLNVMVGGFGEVQVMDWGLAKVLPRADAAGASDVGTERGGGSDTDGGGSETRAGSVLGTPAYMAPEQARGELEQVNERADVFGLGAILCELLTGRPPFAESQALRRAQQGDLSDAFARLDGCGAEAELVALARRCLAPDPAERPRAAAETAAAVTAYRESVERRLRQAEVANAETKAKAVEERKRRRVTYALVALMLFTVACACAGALWYQYDRGARVAEHVRRASDTLRDVTAALNEASTLNRQAMSLRNDPPKWQAALASAIAAAKRAEGVLNSGEGGDDLKSRVTALRAELDAAEKDRRMVARLEEARLQQAVGTKSEMFDIAGSAGLYTAAFQDDMGLNDLGPDEAAALISRRNIREELLDALDDWGDQMQDTDAKRRLDKIAEAADPDPASLRRRWKALRDCKDWDGLQHLLDSPEAKNLLSVSVVETGRKIYDSGAHAEGVRFLRTANELRPGDFWINYYLGWFLNQDPSSGGAAGADRGLRYCTAAVALRPDSGGAHMNLGRVLQENQWMEEAAAEYRKGFELGPKDARAHSHLGLALDDEGKWEEAAAEHRKAIELDPKFTSAHNNLAIILYEQGKWEEATAEFRKAIELDPKYAYAHGGLGELLRHQGKLEEAAVEYRKAIELDPKDAVAHNNLGIVLDNQGKLEEAAAEFRKAIELNAMYAQPHSNLGSVLHDRGQREEAAAEFRKAIAFDPKMPQAHSGLGNVLYDKGDFDGAADCYRKAVELTPLSAVERVHLGNALYAKGDKDGAAENYHKAIELDPKNAPAHCGLGNILHDKRDYDGAADCYRKAIELDPKNAPAHCNLGNALYAKGHKDGEAEHYRKAIELDPKMPQAQSGLGNVLYDKGDYEGAADCYRKAVELTPLSAVEHVHLGNALNAKGDRDGAAENYHKALELDPNNANAHNGLGSVHYDEGKREEAAAEFRKAIELDPKYAMPHNNLGNVLRDQGQREEAAAEYRKAIELDPKYVDAHYNLGVALFVKHQLDEAIAEYRKAIQIQPDYAYAHNGLGWALQDKGQWHEAITEYRKALQIQPDFAAADIGLGVALDLAKRDAVLSAILRGEAAPADAGQQVRFADFCQRYKQMYATASRFYAEAFTAEPGLANDLSSGARYNAASAAARAACGQGADAKELDDRARAGWRKQALEWLRADLSLWQKQLESDKPEDRAWAKANLRDWQEDADLAGLRDAAELAGLPADEREACKKLWADVQALLEKAEAKK